MQVRQWSIKARLVMLSTVAVLGLVVLGLDSLNDMRNSMLEDNKDTTQLVVEIAGGVVARRHDLAKSGALSEDEAKKHADETLRQMRYSGGEYFFILDAQHHFI